MSASDDPILDDLLANLDGARGGLWAIADRYEERGETMLARAYRWLGDTKRNPKPDENEKWCWDKLLKHDPLSRWFYDLPWDVFNALADSGESNYPSRKEAYIDAANALVLAAQSGKGPLAVPPMTTPEPAQAAF